MLSRLVCDPWMASVTTARLSAMDAAVTSADESSISAIAIASIGARRPSMSDEATPSVRSRIRAIGSHDPGSISSARRTAAAARSVRRATLVPTTNSSAPVGSGSHARALRLCHVIGTHRPLI